MALDFRTIINRRLVSQYLVGGARPKPVKAVGHFGAVQAQDFLGACWALGQRCKIPAAGIKELYNQGKILRTHILRPTWHFVLPEDIVWMQAATSERVRRFVNNYHQKVGLDDKTLQKSAQALAAALKGGHSFDRNQIKSVYESAGLDVSGLRFSFMVEYAQLQSLVCSGPMRGKSHTVALISERAPQAKKLPRQQALAELAKRFFTSHGPATARDFAWWSSLLAADVRQAIADAGLKQAAVEGITFYFATDPQEAEIPEPAVHLLPNYDEFTVAYQERRLFYAQLKNKPTYEQVSYHIITVNGLLAGGWRWKFGPKECKISLNLFRRFSRAELAALETALQSLQEFLDLPIVTERITQE